MPHLRALGVEDLERLPAVGLGVAVDLLGVELRPGGGAAARIAHPPGVVADDQDDRVAAILNLADLPNAHCVALVVAWTRGVDPDFAAQRPALAQLPLQSAFWERIHGVPE